MTPLGGTYEFQFYITSSTRTNKSVQYVNRCTCEFYFLFIYLKIFDLGIIPWNNKIIYNQQMTETKQNRHDFPDFS